MKNRFLPFGLISAFLGFFLVYMSAGSMAGQPGTPDLKKHNGSRMDIIRGNQHTGTVDPLDVLKGRLQAADMNTKSTSGPMNLDWINMGPNNYSGAVWSVIFDNSDPTQSTLIAGAAGGGLWKSINLGLTWFQMPSQDNVVPRVSSLVQTSSGTVYAGTGVTQCKVVDVAGTGIYRSDNGGVFTVIPSTQNNPDFAAVAKLVIDPKSGRIFAATFGGLYYSDNGNDWVKAKSGYTMDVCVGSDGTVITATGDSAYIAPEGNLNGWVTLTTGLNNALPKIGIGWMVFAIAPSDPSVMYASFAKTDGNLLNLYCSIDKGATWSVIFPSNPSFEPFRTKGCYSNTLAVFPSDPNRLLLGGINMWYGERIQSAGFFNWEMVSIGAYSPWFPNSAPEYQHSFIFRPNNPNQVAMATDGGVCIATIYPNGFAFKTINKEMTTGQFNSVAFSAQKSYVMGGGENIGVLGMGYFYPLFTNSANDGYPVWMPEGLLTGGNGGTCVWSNIDSRISVFTKYQLTPTAFAATPSTRRRDFTDLTYVNDFMNGIHPVDSSYIPMRLWESFNFTQTRDSVKVYARINTIPADTTLMVESANNRFPFPYVTKAPLVKGDSLTIADPIANRFFYFGRSDETGRGIYMTKDMLKFNRDPRYFLVFKDTKLTDPITTMAISADLNTLWAGTQLGRLIRVSGLINAYDSATANVTSSQCVLTDSVFSFPGVTGRYVTSISINPSNSSQVLVTLGQYGNTTYIYHSQDGNAPRPTFSPKQSNLPQVPVYSGIIEMHNSSSAFVGTELGVFSTTNLNSDNPTWGADMQNIGDVAITEIGQQVINDYHILNKGVIYIATYGRGLWMDTTYSIPVGIEPVQGQPAQHGTLNLSPNPVMDDLNITYASEMSGNLTAVVYDLTGRTVLSRNFGTQPKGTFIGRINLSNLPKGTYLVKLGNGYGKIVKM
jgi:hypothetical protein